LRFATFSRGRGDWPPLAPATVKRRRKGKRGSGQVAHAILRDTNMLFASLQPSSGGLLKPKTLPLGLRVSFGSTKKYSDGPTLNAVATYHHKGGGRLPQRIILALPDPPTIVKMANAGKKIVLRTLGRAA
jgi:hypothetical protein